jgi:hypothetical protein
MQRYPEHDGDFLVREVAGNQVKDLDLSSAEASGNGVVAEMIPGTPQHFVAPPVTFVP